MSGFDYFKWLRKLKVGDEVVSGGAMFYRKIYKITGIDKDVITVEMPGDKDGCRRFINLKTGREVGSRKSSYRDFTIHPATDEERERIKRRGLINEIQDFKYGEFSTRQLENILAFLKREQEIKVD